MPTDVATHVQATLFPLQVRIDTPASPEAVERLAQDAFGLGRVQVAPGAGEGVLRFTEDLLLWNVVDAEGVLGLERRLRAGFSALADGLAGAGGRVRLVRSFGGGGVLVRSLEPQTSAGAWYSPHTSRNTPQTSPTEA